MAIKKQKTTSFHNQWRLHLLLSYTRGYRNRSRTVWWQTPDARTPGSLTHYFTTGFLWCKRQGLLLKGEGTGELWASASSTCSKPLWESTLSIDYNRLLVRPDFLIRHQASVKDGEGDFPNSGEHQREWILEERGHPNTAVTETIKPSQGQVNTTQFCWCSNTTQGRKHSHPRANRQNLQQVQPADGRELLLAQFTALKVAVLTCQ